MFIKKDLSEKIIHNISWRQIRDAFKKICFDYFNKTELATWLFEKEIKELYKEYHNVSYKPTVTEIRSDFVLVAKCQYESISNGVHDWIMTEKIPQYLSITNDIIDLLYKEEMIKPYSKLDDEEGYWEIDQKGHSLRNQLALKRIPRARGIELLTKIKSNIVAYNTDPENCFNIDAVILYGSIVTESETIGDIDLFYFYNYRLLEGEEFRDWIKREEEQQIKHGYKVEQDLFNYKTLSLLKKQINISPYISASSVAGIKEEIEHGFKSMHLWFCRDGYTLSEECELLPKIELG